MRKLLGRLLLSISSPRQDGLGTNWWTALAGCGCILHLYKCKYKYLSAVL